MAQPDISDIVNEALRQTVENTVLMTTDTLLSIAPQYYLSGAAGFGIAIFVKRKWRSIFV